MRTSGVTRGSATPRADPFFAGCDAHAWARDDVLPRAHLPGAESIGIAACRRVNVTFGVRLR
jgi:hypothetical protein